MWACLCAITTGPQAHRILSQILNIFGENIRFARDREYD